MTNFETIDIHAHFFPEAYLRLVSEQGAAFGVDCFYDRKGRPVIDAAKGAPWPLESRYYNLEDRVASMDAQGVDVHALSLTSPMVYWASANLSLSLSQAYNDACVEAHEAYPTRFLGLAMLPVQEQDLALTELERIAKAPGIRGIYMATRILDRELSHPSLFPIYEAIEDLGFTIFLHPIKVVDPGRLKQFYLTNFVGNPTESAIAASHIIFGEVLDRFPKLTFCLPHAGGTFPYLVGRITHGWTVREECRHLKSPPVDYLRRFYYDTITHAHLALDYLISLVGADRVVLGSDFCFDMSYERPVEFVTEHAGLSEADQVTILSGNAKRLLGME